MGLSVTTSSHWWIGSIWFGLKSRASTSQSRPQTCLIQVNIVLFRSLTLDSQLSGKWHWIHVYWFKNWTWGGNNKSSSHLPQWRKSTRCVELLFRVYTVHPSSCFVCLSKRPNKMNKRFTNHCVTSKGIAIFTAICMDSTLSLSPGVAIVFCV